VPETRRRKDLFIALSGERKGLSWQREKTTPLALGEKRDGEPRKRLNTGEMKKKGREVISIGRRKKKKMMGIRNQGGGKGKKKTKTPPPPHPPTPKRKKKNTKRKKTTQKGDQQRLDAEGKFLPKRGEPLGNKVAVKRGKGLHERGVFPSPKRGKRKAPLYSEVEGVRMGPAPWEEGARVEEKKTKKKKKKEGDFFA